MESLEEIVGGACGSTNSGALSEDVRLFCGNVSEDVV